MKIMELLFEKTIVIPDAQGFNFVVTKNPTRSQFAKYKVNPDLDMKGWLSPKDLWIWPAWHAHHHQIANSMGFDPENEPLETIYLFANGIRVTSPKNKEDYYKNHPILKHIYGDDFYIHFG